MMYEVRNRKAERISRSEADGSTGAGPARGAFALVECPPISPGNFILMKRDVAGSAHLIAMGRVRNESASLNLAHVRKLGAELGANEVRLFPAD